MGVGSIVLDLLLNSRDFERQVGGIQRLAKNAGKMLASAFAVKKLTDFGRECLELGSDLAEVQNVVDVTFPAMSSQVDEFAQGAAKAFGLSETMAKQFAGTFGSMAKAFGFSEQQAYDMGTALTGLAGDVASFYNITQDEAYTKLKSVFTGETESLKDLGIVMTQTALDNYALANGFGKTTAKMTEAEKVALRYRFVQEQLSGAAGDFLRTSDGWANQVRVLKLQFDSLKAAIGQGLINMLTPAIKAVNTLVGRLVTLANAFKTFTEMLSGKGDGEAAVQMQATAMAADDAAASTTAIGDAAAASAKKMKGLFAFDDMNVMSKDADGGDTGGASGGYAAESFAAEPVAIDTTAIEAADAKFQALADRARELAGLFRQGFQVGFGNMGELDGIKRSLKGIKDSFLEIISSPEIISGADELAGNIARAFGMVSGSAVSMGLTMAQNLLGGISIYLQGNSGRIKDYLVDMFNVEADIAGLAGDLCAAVAHIFEAFGSENGQRLTANLIGVFADAFMGVSLLAEEIFRDIATVLVRPFTENKEAFRMALEGFLGVLSDVTGTVKQGIDDAFVRLNEVYEEHLRPFFDSIAAGLSNTVGKFMEFWNTYMQPLLEEWALKFDSLWKEHLQPVLESFMELIGSVVDYLQARYEENVKPIIDFIIEQILPCLVDALDVVADQFFLAFGAISDVVSGIIDAVSGIIDFLTGIFTGNWEKAWDGVIKIFDGVWGALKGIVNGILGCVEMLANGVVKGINATIGALNGLSFEVPDWVPVIGGKSFGFNLSSLPEVSIPRLAEGGYVRANAPQLAMIGDNRHQGEIVAPEDKIYQISAQATKDVMQQFMGAMASLVNGAQGKDITVVLKVTGEMAPLVRLLKAELEKEGNRTGVDFKVVYG